MGLVASDTTARAVDGDRSQRALTARVTTHAIGGLKCFWRPRVGRVGRELVTRCAVGPRARTKALLRLRFRVLNACLALMAVATQGEIRRTDGVLGQGVARNAGKPMFRDVRLMTGRLASQLPGSFDINTVAWRGCRRSLVGGICARADQQQ